MSEDRDWRRYEDQIHARLARLAGGDDEATVIFDHRLLGRSSGIDRQVDVYVEGRFAGRVGRGTMVVDAKCFSRHVDVGDIDRFIGFVEDVQTDFGLLITTGGFSAAAEARAAGHRGVRVDVVPYAKLEDWSPDLDFCLVCTDPESERMPGAIYFDAPDDTGPNVLGAEYCDGIGRCEKCDAMHMRCRECGELNSVTEWNEGEWQECAGGCGVAWKVVVERDQKGMEEGETVELRYRR